MTAPSDPRWPAARSLLGAPASGRRLVGLTGISTYHTSVTPRSWHATPTAVREALERFSTWSYTDQIDIADLVAVDDRGDVFDPDAAGGTERAAALLGRAPDVECHLVLGGDNAATWHALTALAGGGLDQWGLVTLDAHLDLRDGVSNGSPVRQLLEAGLEGRHVVQMGLADFSNSPAYAARAAQAGITTWSRDEVRARGVVAAMETALALAGADGRAVYIDVDLDVADRAVVPGCPAAAPGGLSADELRQMVRAGARDSRVRAIDFTEVDVGRDSADERTVRLVALLVLEALAGVGGRS